MKIVSTSLAAGLLALGLSAAAFAQAPAAGTAPAATPPAAAKAPAAAPKAKGVPKQASTPEGTECSAQADAKNLHGKERVKFRKKCISDLKKAAKAGAAAKAPAAAPAAPAAGAPAKK